MKATLPRRREGTDIKQGLGLGFERNSVGRHEKKVKIDY